MIYDVAVIGGGPAGMMAAGRAAECSAERASLGTRSPALRSDTSPERSLSSASVVLFEKNSTLGKKLLITGGGRCNVTNAEFDRRIFLDKFKDNQKFLFSPFSQFGVEEALEFFHQHKMPTKVEAEKRAFPASEKAQSVWDVLVRYMREGKVKVVTSAPGAGFDVSEGKIIGLRLKTGELVQARAYVLATGGKSRPETGSTGEGFEWLKKIGHTIIEPDAALVPLKIKESWVHQLSGVSLKDVKLTLLQNGKKQNSAKGKLLFTHVGVSGPLVLNMSKDVSELLKYGEVKLSIDLMPQLGSDEIDKKVQEIFDANKNKKIKNTLGSLVAPTLFQTLIALSGIDPEKMVNIISRAERMALVRLLKDLAMTVQGLMGLEKAVVTSGGVSLKEVDFKTMQSRLYPNLYLVGDVLNIDRPSGGYSLQLCWTTGFVAGTSASSLLSEPSI